jgi:phosphate-selective porin OprO/OprP
MPDVIHARRAGAAAIACVLSVSTGWSTAWAADGPSVQKQLDELQQAVAAQKAQLEAQQKLLEQQAAVIEQLRKQADESTGSAAAVAKLEQSVNEQKLKTQESGKVSITNGRPTFTSADGRSTAALRAVVQMDMAAHNDGTEGAAATDFRRGSVGATGNRETSAARDLSDGAYFRRARMGFEGSFTRDFEYRMMLELGGSGTEGPTRINDAWIAYTGLAPFRIQLGAFSPAANMEDSTSVEDLLFLERATPSELSRTMGGADGRIGLGIRGSGKRWMSALTLTSRTVNDAEVFDSQLAAVGRFGYLVATSGNYNVHVGLSGTYVLQPADQGSATTPRYAIRFRDRPEIRVDSTRLIDTGSLDADSAYSAGAELGMNYKNYFFQAENFWYGVGRREANTLPDPSFGGYYAAASWVLTGESHRYNMTNGSFQSPRPKVPFSLSAGGWGAWELAARYSHTDLDFHEGLGLVASTPDSVRGGTQNIMTVGVNWYPNTNFRLMLDYMRISVNRLNPAGPGNLTPFGPAPATPPNGVQIGQDLNVVALRSQFSF